MNLREHLSTCAMEECGEITQELSKCLRFGFYHRDPVSKQLNIEKLITEYSQLHAVMEMLREQAGVDIQIDPHAIREKKQRLMKYIQLSADMGHLTK